MAWGARNLISTQVDWTRKDFRSFLNAMERRGRDEVDVIARETSNETGKTEEEVRRGVEFCLRASRRSRRTSRRCAIAPDATPLPRVSERDAVVSTPSPRPLDGAEILTGRYAQVRRSGGEGVPEQVQPNPPLRRTCA